MELHNLTDLLNSDITQAYTEHKEREYEDKNNVRIIVANNKFIYCCPLDFYQLRMSKKNMPFGPPVINGSIVVPRTMLILESRFNENVTRDGIFYTLGNIFGNNSILLGNYYINIISFLKENNLVGKGLRNIKLE